MSPSSSRPSLASTLAALVVLVIPVYYIRFTLFHIPTNLLEILVLITVVVTLVEHNRTGKSLLFPYWRPSSLIFLGLLIGCMVAPDKRLAFGILKGWFIVPLLLSWAVANSISPKTFRPLLWALYANVMFVSLYAILQRYGVIGLLSYQMQSPDLVNYVAQGRALAFFESPNYVAMYLVPPTAFLFLTLRQRWARLSLILPLVALYVSHSRAGLITVFILAVIALLHWLWAKQRMLVGIGLIFAVAVLAWYLKFHINFNGVDTLRLGIWRIGLSLILTHPLWGIGPGQFLSYFQSSHIVSPGVYSEALQYALHPHNLYLNIWLSGGLLAVAGFIWLVLEARNYLLQAKKTANATLAKAAGWALVAVLIHGLFDSTYFKNDLSLLTWLFLATIFVATKSKDSG